MLTLREKSGDASDLLICQGYSQSITRSYIYSNLRHKHFGSTAQFSVSGLGGIEGSSNALFVAVVF
jgi:hypothetical protein